MNFLLVQISDLENRLAKYNDIKMVSQLDYLFIIKYNIFFYIITHHLSFISDVLLASFFFQCCMMRRHSIMVVLCVIIVILITSFATISVNGSIDTKWQDFKVQEKISRDDLKQIANASQVSDVILNIIMYVKNTTYRITVKNSK